MKKLLVLFAAIALIGAFALPAAAADWSFYGSSRMATFMTDIDDKALPPDGDTDVGWALQGNSRIGASVKNGDVSGAFEYGSTPNLRKLYGSWDFGGGSLLVGQTYSPVNIFISNQVYGGDADMLDVGGVYGGRQQMIMLSIADLKVALVNPATSDLGTGGDVDTTIPKIELSWNKSIGPGSVKVVLGYNAFDVEAGATDYSVTSTVLGVMGTANFGAAYVNANVYTGTNTGDYGLWQQGAAGAVVTGTDVDDCSTMGFLVVAGFKASETMNLELGVGSVEHESDVTGSEADDTMAYYVQATIALADGFFIVPEIGGYDYGDDAAGAEEGGMTYFGAKWQMNF